MTCSVAEIIETALRNPDDPACGFTGREVALLNSLPVDEATSVLIGLVYEKRDDQAYKALLEIEGFDRVAFLIQLFDASRFASWACGICQDMADFPDRRIVQKICDIIRSHPDPDVRAFSIGSLVTVLYWLREESALPALRWVAQHDTGADYEGRTLKGIAEWALKEVKHDWSSGPRPQERARDVYYRPDGSLAERYRPKLWPIPE